MTWETAGPVLIYAGLVVMWSLIGWGIYRTRQLDRQMRKASNDLLRAMGGQALKGKGKVTADHMVGWLEARVRERTRPPVERKREVSR